MKQVPHYLLIGNARFVIYFEVYFSLFSRTFILHTIKNNPASVLAENSFQEIYQHFISCSTPKREDVS